MEHTITIYCKNTKSYHEVERGISLTQLKEQLHIKLKYPVIAARVNYKLENLDFLLYKPKDVEFLDISSHSGRRCYVRTLIMVFGCAVHELYPDADLRIEHPICKGYYCTLQGKALTTEMVQAIKERMLQIIQEDRKIYEMEKQTKEVIRIFAQQTDGKATLFRTLGNPYCRYFRMGDYNDYYMSVLMPSSGYINIFDLEPYHDGMLLRVPSRTNPEVLEGKVQQDKMFKHFSEYSKWNKLMNIANVGDFNNLYDEGKSYEMIKLAEALHEKKVGQIADAICNREGGCPKLILISGPSASGKTSFAQRLRIQLMVNGLKPLTVSMDNYFVNRVDTPKDENGEWDFEDINALDLKLFRDHLHRMLQGEEVEMPHYSFEKGEREWLGEKIKMNEDNILIVEGIHALNPNLLPNVPKELTYRIFVSVLTTINLDNHNWIPTTDIRLLRRIVRDYRTRGFSGRDTIARCPSVVRGELKWIYPYQEEADAMFNSALLFELAVLKQAAEPVLAEVPKFCNEYTEAHRLLKFLQYFRP
ncbi:MAG: nucleoside kinase, partial [Paludibacteraceae bacterium]|nr:nucleoside kinase [Paludibacteraceae bacterium]